MKKHLCLLGVCLATTALAQSSSSSHSTGVDATQVGPAIQDTAKKVVGQDAASKQREAETFQAASAFDLHGTVKEAKRGHITVERSGLPPAQLAVKDPTQVWLDGKRVKADAIPEGLPVRARFQLNGASPVAVEVIASTPSGPSGSNSGPNAPMHLVD
ncbi:hypothetical protein DRW03_15395 [Corallococcus sp. H22C18031201]|uniref:hypothetical protein n=1 Tax=Citreicoccus inhibens TaxID=2849499 RepID=UPI000E70744D|nr:hypothetical protein [Citreicoccus inhibens]MBU8897931.1 hypothetical protein [Citreicoccus inhibens]RJS21732.1 hypothetical protein DRW03_15395 [Corallococcus sp. H22C18031201]